MSNDVALTAALRNNLLSLQKTQSAIDSTQLRLATGRKVNSALDGPQAFFASQALNNRANDLQRLLDSVGQSIQVIKAADNGVTALTTLIEQATSIATSAREATTADAESASVTGDTDIRDFEADAAYNNATITFTATDADGFDVTITGGAGANNNEVTITTDMTSDEIVKAINDLKDDEENQLFQASLNSSGKLQIKSLNGVSFRAEITAGTDDNDSAALASELGLGSIAKEVGNGTSVAFSSKASSTLNSSALYKADGETLAQRSTTLGDLLRDANGDGTVGDNVFSASDADDTGNEVFSITIGLNGGGATRIDVSEDMTIQGLIDSINGNSVLKNKIEASFNEETGQISLRVTDPSVKSIEMGQSIYDDDNTAAGTMTSDFGFGLGGAQTLTSTDVGREDDDFVESIRLGAAAGELGQYESDFNRVRQQIDQLVADAGYRGTNLLAGDDLLTVFNENRSSSLTTKGVDFSAEGLGITEASFGSLADIEDTLNQVRDALASVRNFGTTLANDLTVIQTREEFTTNLINTLTEGSDKLTLADQNEEGAKLLSLQTRQQLGVTSLSLASQSQQSILRLF